MSKEKWTELLSEKRLGSPEKDSAKLDLESYGRTPFDRDYAKVIFSNQFRRLQDKTQVFPLSKSDHTHTRLTHSLEVSSLGNSLGKAFGKKIEEELPQNISPSDIGTIVSVSCLAHDIGNPPFGHSGESSIQEWAAKHLPSDIKGSEREDFINFEGNAQGFRICSRLWDRSRHGGGQFTYAVYGSLLKYPQGSISAKKYKLDSEEKPIDFVKNCAGKKFNYFESDKHLAEEVLENLSMKEDKNGLHFRHPLAYIMEAADDMCYRIIDLEDAVDQKLISRERFEKLALNVIPKKLKNQLKGADPSLLRAHVIGSMLGHVSRAIDENLQEIINGTLKSSLIDCISDIDADVFNAIESLSNEASEHIYTDDRVLKVEYAGFKVIGGLLDEFLEAIPSNLSETVKLSKSGKKLLSIFPKKYLIVRPDLYDDYSTFTSEELIYQLTPYERMIAITDYISGMTDSYALDLYQKLTGVSIP